MTVNPPQRCNEMTMLRMLLMLPLVLSAGILPAASTTLVINAFCFDPNLSGESDEAVEIMNISYRTIDLSGIHVCNNTGDVAFPSGSLLAPLATVWITGTATSFQTEYGFNADFEYGNKDSDPTVPNMTGIAPIFANSGDYVLLKDSFGTPIDLLVYKEGATTVPGWEGPSLCPFDNGSMSLEGQVLYRKMDEVTDLPIPDTDSAADWAQHGDDNFKGKKVRYPGWDLYRYFRPTKTNQEARLEYFVAPDNIFENYIHYLNQANQSIWIECDTFKSPQIADVLVSRLQEGVQVRILLDGGVIGGISDQEKWACREIEKYGGECWYLKTDPATGIKARYAFQHAKLTIIDNAWLITGSENLDPSSMPADAKENGTEGNRGIYIATDASDVVIHALDVFEHDLDPANHVDIRRWSASIDSPPVDFVPDYGADKTTYLVQFWNPLILEGMFNFEVVQSPENSCRERDSIHKLVERAGAGGKVFVEQLCEDKYWGVSTSNPVDDPNLRLEAYIQAARRGAEVKVILDSTFNDPNDPRGNSATCAYIDGIASSERLNLQCKVGAPTHGTLHNTMILVWDGAAGWTHTGSINGSEISNKNNRELALQIQSTAGYQYLRGVFDWDWVSVGGTHSSHTRPVEKP